MLKTNGDILREIQDHPASEVLLLPWLQEHQRLQKKLGQVELWLQQLQFRPRGQLSGSEAQSLGLLLGGLAQAEPHHQAEILLHQALEELGLIGVPQCLAAQSRLLKESRRVLQAWFVHQFNQVGLGRVVMALELQELLKDFIQGYRDLIEQENLILFPTALDWMPERSDWLRLAQRVAYLVPSSPEN